jgi:hypothetical protein
VQTWLVKNAPANKPIEFTIAGTGNMPREQQGAAAGGPAGGAGMGAGAPDGNSPDAGTAAPTGQPGGGIGPPVSGTEPLTKYKWWILGALALLLIAAAAFLLRKPAGFPATDGATGAAYPSSVAYPAFASPASKNTALLNALKEEMFALESERISGTLAPEEYAETKAALEIVLKRALKRTS